MGLSKSLSGKLERSGSGIKCSSGLDLRSVIRVVTSRDRRR